MKLSTKFLLWLLLGLACSIAATQALQLAFSSAQLRRQMQRVADNQIALLEKREVANAGVIFDSIQRGVNDSIERGEMQQFQQLIEQLKDIPSLDCYILFDRHGRSSYATTPELVGKEIAPEVIETVLKKGEPYFRQNGSTFEFYRPIPIVADCRRCHHNWPESGISGAHFISYSTESLEASKEAVSKDAAAIQSSNLQGIILAFCILLPTAGGLSWFLLYRLVNRPLLRVMHSLAEDVRACREGSDTLGIASEQLASGATEQAAALEQTSASLEELSSMTGQNVKSSQGAKELSDETSSVADIGQAEMSELAVAMQQIQDSSNEISKIIKAIDKIAFQTNILALNAAVEAARAGEAGAGFAVVADEVRSLAGRAAEAARETEQKISSAIEKSGRGVEVSQRVAGVLTQIVEKAKQVNSLVSQVASASKEQNSGIEQITTSVHHMDQSTQQVAKQADDTLMVAENMKKVAEMLEASALEMETLIHGEKGQGNTQPPA